MIIPVFLMAFSLQGCFKERAEVEKDILEHDPSFRTTIDARNLLIKQMDSEHASYIKKEQDMNEKISVLKAQKQQARRDYQASVEDIKRRLQPEKRRMERELIEMQRDYDGKKREIVNIQSDIKEITALTEKKDKLSLTQEEMRTWNDRLAALIEKKDRLSADSEKLKKDIEVTRLKIKIHDI